MRAPLSGGAPRAILEDVLAADWTRDGSAFAVARHAVEGARIEYPVGTVLGEAENPLHLRLSPSGEMLAFGEHPVPMDDRGSVVVIDKSGKRSVLSGEWASLNGLAWAPEGEEIWFTAAREGADTALYAVDLSGEVRVVAPAFGRLAIQDISSDGRVLLKRSVMRLELAFRTADGETERDLSWFDFSSVEAISADGGTVLFTESGEGGGSDYGVFLRGTDGSPAVRLGSGRAMDLSPDGNWVLAIPLKEPTRIDILPTGAGEQRTIADASILRYLWAGWLPDGKRIVFTGIEPGHRARLYVRDLGTGPPRPITPEGIGVKSNTVSPDGRFVVARCRETGFCLYPIDGGDPRVLSGVPPDGQPLWWHQSGESIFVRQGAAPDPVQLSRVDLATGRSRPWRKVHVRDPAGLRHVFRFVGTPDGRAFAYSFARELSELYVVENLH